MNQLQAMDIAGKKARAHLRDAGFQVKAVAWIRAQHEGEFASIDKWPSEDRVLEMLTHPANRTLEFSRETKGQIFVKFSA